jgi:hypothetical protein
MHAPSAVREADSVVQSCATGMHLGPAKNCTISALGIMRFHSGEVGEVSQHYIGKTTENKQELLEHFSAIGFHDTTSGKTTYGTTTITESR